MPANELKKKCSQTKRKRGCFALTISLWITFKKQKRYEATRKQWIWKKTKIKRNITKKKTERKTCGIPGLKTPTSEWSEKQIKYYRVHIIRFYIYNLQAIVCNASTNDTHKRTKTTPGNDGIEWKKGGRNNLRWY